MVTTEKRLTKIEVELEHQCVTIRDVQKDVKRLMRNHIPHIHMEIQKVKEEVHKNKWSIALIIGVAVFILSTAANFLMDKLL